MNKTALKNFAVWARNKLIADITYKAGLMGITEAGIKTALPQSTKDTEFYDIGTKEPYLVGGEAVKQRRRLVELINGKTVSSNYKTAFHSVIEEVAYTWFNRLIAVRFMEVNDYLPSHIRVLSSESADKLEPDLVTTPFDADLELTETEKAEIVRLKNENQVDALFRMLFIKQCNELNGYKNNGEPNSSSVKLPKLFEKTADYSELLLNVSVTDQDGVVYHLVHDIPEDDFNIEKGGQVEIIGWLYQYYNTEPKDETFALLKKNVKITKERIPSATQLFTPDWIVRYMVENSLGRLWLEGHPNDSLKSGWKYYLDEAKQEPEVQAQLDKIREEYKTIKPEDIKVIDPCMGSGHILVYAFDVLMQIYETAGYSQRDAAKSILEHNLYGLDIDDRAFQLAYFAVMMKARQYNRFILNGEAVCHIYSIQESNGFNPDYLKLLGDNNLKATAEKLITIFTDAKEYGSILNVDIPLPELEALQQRIDEIAKIHYDNFFDSARQSGIMTLLVPVVQQAIVMAQKYDVVVTNPPYMGSSGMGAKLSEYVKKNYPDSKSDLSTIFMEKAIYLCNTNGFISMINIPVWMFISSFEKLRVKIINEDTIINMIHLGRGVFGSDFGTTSFVISKNRLSGYLSTYKKLFTKQGAVDGIEDKKERFLSDYGLYYRDQHKFSMIPGIPIAYWVSPGIYSLFSEPSISRQFIPKFGMSVGDGEKFTRYWFEPRITGIAFSCANADEFIAQNKKWCVADKGGTFRKWYGNQSNVIWWKNNGFDIKNHPKSAVRNSKYFFEPHISWTLVSSGQFSARFFGNGFLLDTASNCIYFTDEKKSLSALGYLNSKVASNILSILNPTINMSCGVVGKVPFSYGKCKKVDSIVKNLITLSKTDWSLFETSWDFTGHPLVNWRTSARFYRNDEVQAYLVEDSFKLWKEDAELRFSKLKSNEEELNRIFIDIYGLQDELTPEVADKDVTVARIYDTKEEIPESMKGNNYVLTKCDVMKSFLSYAVGCIFGRYSLDVDGLAYAGGEWDDSKYSNFLPDKDNILPITDEAYFEDDIVGRFVEFVKAVYGEATLEENLDFIANALGNKGNTSREVIRNYFLNDFFKDHCKTYKKRPIYWLFDSGKQNGFKALIYLHRYNENTIGNLRIDYLHRMERVYESEIARMQDMIDNSANAREVTAATKRKEKLQKQIKECKEYDEKIAHLALARIAIDLDDGVKVNYEKVQTDTDGKLYQVLAKI